MHMEFAGCYHEFLGVINQFNKNNVKSIQYFKSHGILSNNDEVKCGYWASMCSFNERDNKVAKKP